MKEYNAKYRMNSIAYFYGYKDKMRSLLNCDGMFRLLLYVRKLKLWYECFLLVFLWSYFVNCCTIFVYIIMCTIIDENKSSTLIELKFQRFSCIQALNNLLRKCRYTFYLYIYCRLQMWGNFGTVHIYSFYTQSLEIV